MQISYRHVIVAMQASADLGKDHSRYNFEYDLIGNNNSHSFYRNLLLYAGP